MQLRQANVKGELYKFDGAGAMSGVGVEHSNPIGYGGVARY